MLPAFLLKLAPSFIPEPLRKAFGAGVILLGLVALIVIGVKIHDHRVVKNYTNAQEAKTAKADRKADNTAAVQRRVDDARSRDEAQEVKEAISEAQSQGRDPRAAYYACVKLQQSARREHKPSPNC